MLELHSREKLMYLFFLYCKILIRINISIEHLVIKNVLILILTCLFVTAITIAWIRERRMCSKKSMWHCIIKHLTVIQLKEQTNVP